jgi:hypothetical protein
VRAGRPDLALHKTTEAAYFQPGSSTNLRWCVKEVTAADGRTWLVGAGGHGVGGTPLAALAERLLVTYPDRGHAATPKEPGLLGGFVPVAPGAVLPDFKTDPDLRGPHYALLPPDRVIPLGSGFNPVPVVELSFGHPLDFPPADGDASINLWHAEIRPRVHGEGAITMRYVEHGITPVPGAPRSLWTQTEEYTFRTDGLVSAIRQWQGPAVAPLCWRRGLRCDPPGSMTVDARLIEAYVPGPEPLRLALRDDDGSGGAHGVRIGPGEAYTLQVRTSSGAPYSGFLEIRTSSGLTELWRDPAGRPIYVSGGSVRVPPEGYGNLRSLSLRFAVRPYLTNASVNSLEPVDTAKLIPNASTAAWSNESAITIGAG